MRVRLSAGAKSRGLRGESGRVVLATLVLGASAAACTVVNSFESVKSPPEVDASFDAAGDTAAADAASQGRGVIVIGGVVESDAGSQLVLTALDPTTGAELPRAREPMKVAAVVYDGLRELWYIFESGGDGFIPQPTDKVFFHVRELDTTTGLWNELQKIEVPPELSFATIAAVRERVGYVAYGASATDGGATYDFVSIDTSNPSAPVLRDRMPMSGAPVGAVGTRSTAAAGGVINFLERGTCGDAGACVQFVRALLPPTAEAKLTSVTPATTTGGIVPYGGGPTFAHVQSTGLDVVGSRGATSPATVHFFQPLNGQPGSPPITFDVAGSTLKPLAVAECQFVRIRGEHREAENPVET